MAYERTPTRTQDLWTDGDQSRPEADLAAGVDLTGYGVEAIDGSIGKVDEAINEVGASYIVVSIPGPWIFGKTVMLPTRAINRVDAESETIFVDLTKDEIKEAPEIDDAAYPYETYRDVLGGD